MKQTLRVNISGAIFHMDEDAHQRLERYLQKLKSHYSDEPGGKEIIEDIEARIRELFSEKLTSLKKEVISLEMVEETLKILGEPEEIYDETNSGKQKEYNVPRQNRRLYRDPENSIIGGVCSGFSAYFNMDVVWVRIIAIVLGLMNGFGVLLYIIFWMVVPAAKTRSQRLEMKGETVNLSNIEKDIRDDYDQSAGLDSKRKRSMLAGFIHEIIILAGMVLKFCFKVFLVFIGFIFVIAGFGVLTALFTLLFFNYSIFPFSHGFGSVPFHSFLNGVISQENLLFILISAFLLLAIPLVALIYGGLKLLFKFRANDKLFTRSMLILWILSLITCISLSLYEGRNFSSYQNVTSEQVIQMNSDKIYLQTPEAKDGMIYKEFRMFNDELVYCIFEGDKNIYPVPELTIKKSNGNKTELVLIKKSFGSSREDAIQRANSMGYHWEKNDSIFIFDPFYLIPKDNPWFFSRLEIILKVPKGKKIYLSKNLEIFTIHAYTDDYVAKKDLLDKSWVMTGRGLVEEE